MSIHPQSIWSVQGSPCGQLLEFGHLLFREQNGKGIASTEEEPWDSQGTGAALGTGQPHPGRKDTVGNPQQESWRQLGVTLRLHPGHALLLCQLATRGWGNGGSKDVRQGSQPG